MIRLLLSIELVVLSGAEIASRHVCKGPAPVAQRTYIPHCIHSNLKLSTAGHERGLMGVSGLQHSHAQTYLNCRHWTLKSPHEQYLEAKKSKFYAFAWPVQSFAAARETIAVHSDPKASHNCSAFLISGTNSHCTDDGEPSGTAGRPILSAIEAEGLQVRMPALPHTDLLRNTVTLCSTSEV